MSKKDIENDAGTSDYIYIGYWKIFALFVGERKEENTHNVT